MTAPKKKPTKRHAPKPKKQQATSREAIIRARVKELALQFRIQGFTLRDIVPAINEALGPEGEALPGFKPYKSPHAITDMLTEAIKEAVDPLKKEELLFITTSGIQSIVAACMGPAQQGSIAHAQTAMQAFDRLIRLTGIAEKEGEGGAAAGSITQIFLNGNLANV